MTRIFISHGHSETVKLKLRWGGSARLMSDLTEQEVRAFVGPHADYYLQKWRRVLESTGDAGKVTGVNWAAFLLCGLWLPYRKMYRATAILYGVVLLETILEEIIFVGFLGKPEAPALLGGFVSLVVGLVCGWSGNAWYLSHTEKAIAGIRSQSLAEDAYSHALARRGGTSMGASLGFLILALCAMFAIIFLSELLRS